MINDPFTFDMFGSSALSSGLGLGVTFTRHPGLVRGTHALTSGPFVETYTCRPHDGEDLEAALAAAINLQPAEFYDGKPTPIDLAPISDSIQTGRAVLPFSEAVSQ